MTVHRILVGDGETSVHRRSHYKGDTDNSPYNKNNRLVSFHWRLVTITDKWVDGKYEPEIVVGDPKRSIFYHNEQAVPESPKDLQEALDWADIFVAHNAKFDILWLLESGFHIPKRVWCTMIGEYVEARGKWVPISLKESAIRRNVTRKKDDLVSEMFDSGVGFEAMPLDIVIDYADTDVLSCAEIFIQQWKYYNSPASRSLPNIIKLMNEMLLFLVEIERNGIAIDGNELARVKKEFEDELAQLQKDLNAIVVDVMGDIPINLNSGEDITKVVYSREVIDKNLHKATFNIGKDEFGNDQYPPRMSPTQFANAVRTTTRRVEKATALHCRDCKGKGVIRKTKKNGEPFKNESKCPFCGGVGFTLAGQGRVAGLKLVPEGPRDASINGFKAGSDEIDRLIDQAKRKDNLQAVEFLTKKKRLNAVNTYLNSFVGGIERWTREDGILHANFNQCVARTGRLSSSDPNFQNQPKGHKFPVRRTVVSRWKDDGGLICEADFSGLEFVVAGELSRDKQIIEDILNGKDTHAQTAVIINEIPKEKVSEYEFKGKDKQLRNDAKPYTFAPLYGGQGANEPPHIRAYFKEFFKIYSDHEQWQFDQMDRVIKYGYIATPSGREYEFPGTRRLKGRRTTNATNIVNYPVQGFATGDIVPLACVRALRKFRELGLNSLLILTVHDSIVVDVFPGELARVVEALNWAMNDINEEIKERWGHEMVLPLRSEVSVGKTWGDLEDYH